MQQKFDKYESYVSILKEELIPAMGCTEPIAIAYCASIVRDTLGHIPTDITVYVSGNILKNVKSVTVPNTGGMQGIDVACAIGLIAGDANKKLEVIADVLIYEYCKLWGIKGLGKITDKVLDKYKQMGGQ